MRLQLVELAVGRATGPVLTDLGLALPRGRCLALVGANASGKTTLLQTIAGRLPPLRGQVLLDGVALYPPRREGAQPPGFAVPVDDLPRFLTLRQCVELHAQAHGLPMPPRTAGEFFALPGLEAQADTLVAHASLGTRQKVAIELALRSQSGLLLLDEVFNGLDFRSTTMLRSLLRARVDAGQSVVLATHSLDLVLGCADEVALLDGGRLAHHWQMSEFAGADGLSALARALADASAG